LTSRYSTQDCNLRQKYSKKNFFWRIGILEISNKKKSFRRHFEFLKIFSFTFKMNKLTYYDTIINFSIFFLRWIFCFWEKKGDSSSYQAIIHEQVEFLDLKLNCIDIKFKEWHQNSKMASNFNLFEFFLYIKQH
jgi:hypothetical protein